MVNGHSPHNPGQAAPPEDGYRDAPTDNNPNRGREPVPEEADGCPHDNDADGRPRIYGRTSTPHGEVELTVQGAEGERVTDVADAFDEKLDRLVDAQDDLNDADDDPNIGVQ